MSRHPTAHSSNARNNAEHQELRLERWAHVRDAAWALLEPHVRDGHRVLIVGAGNGDDLPLRRLVAAGVQLTLVDLDADALARASERIAGAQADVHVVDVTDGAVDRVLRRAAGAWWRSGSGALTPPTGPIAGGGFDLVIGDMLYTQLLHPGLIALGLDHAEQRRLMHRYDPVLRDALVQRLHASAVDGGSVVHIHDLACWASNHPQPRTLDEVMADPEGTWLELRRHDRCDPMLAAGSMELHPVATAWWRWVFEPRTSYAVRGIVVPARST